MPSSTLTKFNAFVEHLAEGVHNFQSHQLKVALTNIVPVVGHSLLADITQISYTNFVNGTTTGRDVALAATSPSTQTGGVYKLILQDLVLTGQTAATDNFRYVVLYNDGTSVLTDPLIGWYDYTSSISLNPGETLTIDFDQVNGVFTLT
jgi:hypothetical protein